MQTRTAVAATPAQTASVVPAPAAAAAATAPAAAAPTVTSTGAAGTYTVTAADTLSAIGVRFGVDWMRIAEANGIAGPNYLVRSGQTLTIPAR